MSDGGYVRSEDTQSSTPQFWAMPAPKGEFYQVVLRRFHETFKPGSYFETGVEEGKTLELANCPSIGVDPKFAIDKLNLKEVLLAVSDNKR